MKISPGELSFWILMLLFALNLKPTLLSVSLENYKVHSKPVYFHDEFEDMVYIRGSTIELQCHASCNQDCIHRNKIYYNGKAILSKGLTLTDDGEKLTIKIDNASINNSGVYQCLRPVWPWRVKDTNGKHITDIVGRNINVQITDLGQAQHTTKILSSGDSVLLPCNVNTPNNVYPPFDSIEWWKGANQLDYNGQDSTFITQDGSLLVTNVTTNIASYHCVIHWKNPGINYNASYYQILIGQPDTYQVHVYPENIKVKVGDGIQFVCAVSGFGQNYSIKWYSTHSPENALLTTNHSHVLDIPVVGLDHSGTYYCVVINESGRVTLNGTSNLKVIEPPMIVNITSDVLINTSVANNVTLKCSFTGDLTQTSVYWMRNSQNITRNVIIHNKTAILSLSIDADSKTLLGSYQCVVTNEVGYISRTARILPKGWTSPPRNLKATIENCNINLSWNPPLYDGGVPVHCYKLVVYDFYDEIISVLGDCLTTTFYSWDLCHTFISIEDFIKFKVAVVDKYENPRSGDESSRLLNIPKNSLKLMVDCTGNDVKANWSGLVLYPHEYCLKYWCNAVEKEMCNMNHTTSGTILSVNTTCWFVVTAKGVKQTHSNNISCYIPVVPAIISNNVTDQMSTKGETVTFTCQAAGKPFPNISWYFNDIPINESDKHLISTKPLNSTSSNSTLTVKSVLSSDVGTYTCYATNEISTDASSGVLSVTVAPDIISPETEQAYDFTEGDNITCNATGYPPPDIVWLNNNGSVVDENRLVLNSVMATGVGNVSSRIVSMIVRRGDNGVYKCLANNSISNDTSAISITVKWAPVIIITGPEEVHTVTAELYNFTDGDTITCTATGYPLPDIVWLNNDGSIVDENRLVESTNVGNIPNKSVSVIVRRGDDGVYTCVANNSVGNDNSNINITVQYPIRTGNKSNIIWLLTVSLISVTLLLFVILLLTVSFIRSRVSRRFFIYGPPPEILDDFDEGIKDACSYTEEVVVHAADDRSDCNSIDEYNIEKMYAEILCPRGDPVVNATSLISLCSSAESIVDSGNDKTSPSHYYDSSSSSSNTGNSVQTHQQCDSGNPIVDSEVTVTNEVGYAFNDIACK